MDSSHPEDTISHLEAPKSRASVPRVSLQMQELLNACNIGDMDDTSFEFADDISNSTTQRDIREWKASLKPEFAEIDRSQLKFGAPIGQGASAIIHAGAYVQFPAQLSTVAIKVFFSMDVEEFKKRARIYS